MTWPAPDLPIAYTNTTVSFDTHPEAHNDTNTSLNTNFKPELTRVGDELAGTQSVLVGTDPNAAASILSDSLLIDTVTGGISMRPNTGYVLNSNAGTAGRIQRNDINSTAIGFIAAWDGSVRNWTDSSGGFTTGTPYVAYGVNDLPIPVGKWSRGGYIDVLLDARFAYNTGFAEASIRLGYKFAPGDAFIYAGRPGTCQVKSTPHMTSGFPQTTLRLAIPSGATYIGLTVGVSATVTTEIVTAGMQWMEHTY